MKRLLYILWLFPSLAFAQTSNVNPVPGAFWQNYGPTLGAGWSAEAAITGGPGGTIPLGITTVYAKQYGVKADRIDIASGGAINAATTALTVSGAAFSASDVGKIIIVAGAGPSGGVLLTTISSVVNAAQVMLAATASTTVSNAAVQYATNDVPAAQLAINAAAALPAGGHVILPAGKYIINPATGKLALASNITLDGEGAANILCADANPTTSAACIYGTGITNIEVRNLILNGLANIMTTRPINDFEGMIDISLSTKVRLLGNSLSYARGYATHVTGSTTVTMSDNTLSYTLSGNLACGNCIGDVIITGNHVDHAADAMIGVSTYDLETNPNGGRGVVITGNTAVESVGMQIAGARSLVISNNSLTRMRGQAIWVFPYTAFEAGDTSNSAVTITGNTVLDVINHAPGSPLVVSFDAYIIIGGGPRGKGGGAEYPGYPAVTTGVVRDFYGTNTSGLFFAGNTDDAAVASPGSMGWNISNNMFIRTLPPVADYSQWGYGATMWGAAAGGALPYTGPIAETDLNLNCILVRETALRYAAIHNNTCMTSGDYDIFFRNSSVADGDYEGVSIKDNVFYNYKVAGINFNTTTTPKSQMQIEGNTFNADPLFQNSNRGTGGTWAANLGPLGISMDKQSGAYINRNKYRNLNNPYYFGAGPSKQWVGDDETIFSLPAAVGFSTSNIGVGVNANISGTSNLFRVVCEDGDPRNATYGQITTVTSLASLSVPTTGCWLRGTFVRNTNSGSVDAQGRTLIGWQRITTGVGNVVDTDWKAIYSGPPTGAWIAGFNFQTGTTYTVVAADMGKALGFSNGGAIAVDLPTANSAGFESNKCFSIVALGAGTVTITPATGQINAAANKAYATGTGGTICAVSTNYWAF